MGTAQESKIPPAVEKMICELASKEEQPAINGICQQVPLPDCQAVLTKSWDKLLQKCPPAPTAQESKIPPAVEKMICELASKEEQPAINEICQQVPLPDCQAVLTKAWDKLLQKCPPAPAAQENKI